MDKSYVERMRERDPIGYEQTRLVQEMQIALKLAMEDAGLNQTRVAEKLGGGGDQTNVSKVLNGHAPTIASMARVAYALGLRFKVELAKIDG